MSVEPTLGEVIRTLERIEQEFTRRLNELTDALGRVVTVDVYDAHRSATNDRIDNIRGEINAVRNEAREVLELNPIEGLDEPLTPMNTVAGQPPTVEDNKDPSDRRSESGDE